MFIVIVSTSSNISSRRFRDILNHDEEMNEGEENKEEEGKDGDGEAEANPRDIVRSPSSVSTGTQVTYFKDLEN